MSDVEVDPGPRSTFHTYMAEGDQLFLKGEYMKAKASYSTVSWRHCWILQLPSLNIL